MARFVLLACLASVGLAAAVEAQDARGRSSPPAPGAPAAPGAAGAVKPASGFAAVPVPPAPPAPPLPPNPMLSGGDYGGGCGPGGCGAWGRLAKLCGGLCCDECCTDERGWLRADYVLWSVQGGALPPLAVRDAPGTPLGAAGLPATPGQQLLFGGTRLNDEMRSGVRISAGVFGEGGLWAVSGDLFYLASNSDGARFNSSGGPLLSRPFFNVATGAPDAEVVAFPGVASGSVTFSERNTFVGAGGFFQHALWCGGDACHGYRVDFIAGYRYYGMNDDLRIRENRFTTDPGATPAGTAIVIVDQFRTENTFHGGLIGLTGGKRHGCWAFDFRAGVALGAMNRELLIDGSTTVQAPGQPAVGAAAGCWRRCRTRAPTRPKRSR